MVHVLQVSSVLSRAGNLSDVDYLLIHGTGDGEVFLPSSLSLSVFLLTHLPPPFLHSLYSLTAFPIPPPPSSPQIMSISSTQLS